MFPNLQKRFLVAVFCEAFLGGSLRVPCWWNGVLIGCYAIFLCGSGSLWDFFWVVVGTCWSLCDFCGCY